MLQYRASKRLTDDIWQRTFGANVLGPWYLARAGQPNEIADACLFMARPGYITGQVLVVDGGMSVKIGTYSVPQDT